MQWTTTGDRITLPYVAPEDDLQSTPATIKALAEAVVAELELATPVGAISPYMGDVAPDGWLICDGSEYAPADLPELYAVNSAFHADDAPGEFRVPDLRGRSPIGINPNVTTASWGPDSGPTTVQFHLGERVGDWRVHDHDHRVVTTAWAKNMRLGKEINPSAYQVGAQNQTIIYGPNGGDPAVVPMVYARTLPTDDGYGQWPGYPLEGQGRNLSPATGVNFIVYAGRPTTGISPLSELAPVTTRDMIEARLAQAGIGEEEVKMLKEQLEELKRTEAK